MVHDDAWSIGPAPRQTSTSGYLISKTIEIEIVVIFVIIVVHPRAPAIVLVVLSFYLVVPAFPQPAIQPGLAGSWCVGYEPETCMTIPKHAGSRAMQAIATRHHEWEHSLDDIDGQSIAW